MGVKEGAWVGLDGRVGGALRSLWDWVLGRDFCFLSHCVPLRPVRQSGEGGRSGVLVGEARDGSFP